MAENQCPSCEAAGALRLWQQTRRRKRFAGLLRAEQLFCRRCTFTWWRHVRVEG